jgi:hypothetical protein
LCDAAVDDQVMPVVHQHMPAVAGMCGMGVGFSGQQGVGIATGALGFVAELDAAEIPFGPLLSSLGSTKTFARP